MLHAVDKVRGVIRTASRFRAAICRAPGYKILPRDKRQVVWPAWMVDCSIVCGERVRGSQLVHKRNGRIVDDVSESLVFHNYDHYVVERVIRLTMQSGCCGTQRIRES